MRLADFIVSNVEPILVEWEEFARSITAGANLDSLALRDHAEEILRATARDMRSEQSATQRTAKSRGRSHPVAGGDGDGDATTLNGASETHAIGRLGSGFDLLEVVSEYRALRASVLRLWRESGPPPDELDVDDLMRFDESIDQSITKAVGSYTKRVEQSRDLFLAILSHDLRNPLNSISMSAALLPTVGRPEAEAVAYASQIGTDARVMGRISATCWTTPGRGWARGCPSRGPGWTWARWAGS